MHRFQISPFTQNQQGFSTILALLLTGFLLTLSAGVLFLELVRIMLLMELRSMLC
jgi:hypothetical protein